MTTAVARPAVARPAPGTLQGVVREPERRPGGGVAETLTVFLTGAECPFSCVFCDLWRHAHAGPTPPGSLPAQLRAALARDEARGVDVVKLYNASNFFDRRAVPEADDAALAALVARFDRVVVESHPRLVGDRAACFAARLDGVLEVAMGLETTDSRAFPRLGKGAGLDDYRRAAHRIHAIGGAVRVFLLVGVPFVPPDEQVAAAVAAARFAVGELGAVHVALVPVRSGEAAMTELAATGDFVPPTLGLLEDALDACLAAAPEAVVAADVWDLERLAACGVCFAARRDRLRAANLTGAVAPRVACAACEGT